MNQPTRPILRYHGGKWEMAPWIISLFPSHRVYVEPFGGGGSVLLRKPRSYAEIYNDLDGEVVNLFQVARDRGHELCRALELTPFARTEFTQAYDPVADPVERARRMVIRAFMGHGSNGHQVKTGFRADAQSSGTTPARDWRNFPTAFVKVVERLRGVVIENRSALSLIERFGKKDALIYADPPYVHSTRTDRRGDYAYEMSDADHRELAAALNATPAAVVLSGYHSPLYDELYAGWERAEKATQADGGAARVEVLWMRNVDRGDLPGLVP